MLACPECGSMGEFVVSARQDILLDSNEDHIIESFKPAVYWDDWSDLRCCECGFEASKFWFHVAKPDIK